MEFKSVFVTTGNSPDGFFRLITAVDELIQRGILPNRTTIQIGGSDYIPRNGDVVRWLGAQEYEKILAVTDVIICHGGTGSLVKAVKQGKKVIAVPRREKYNEHLDDHQMEVCNAMQDAGHILCVEEMEYLEQAIQAIDEFQPRPFPSGTQFLIDAIDDFIFSRNKN